MLESYAAYKHVQPLRINCWTCSGSYNGLAVKLAQQTLAAEYTD